MGGGGGGGGGGGDVVGEQCSGWHAAAVWDVECDVRLMDGGCVYEMEIIFFKQSKRRLR